MTLNASSEVERVPPNILCTFIPKVLLRNTSAAHDIPTNIIMPERPPYPGRPAQPPGQTYIQYSPDGKRMLVAGCGNYARSFNTGDNGEPDMLTETHEDTYAVACGVRFIYTTTVRADSVFRTTMPSWAAKMARCASTGCRTASSTRCLCDSRCQSAISLCHRTKNG